MTFRGRLRLFFGMIVVVPMIAIGAVLFALTADSERGKSDARLATELDRALLLYQDGREAAAAHARRIRGRLAAIAAGDERTARARLEALVRSDPRIVMAALSDGGAEVRAGSPRGVAPATFRLRRAGGSQDGRLTLSVTDARALVRAAGRRPRSAGDRQPVEFVVLRADKPVGASAAEAREVPKGAADFEAGGREYRGRRVIAGRPDGVTEEIAVFQEAGDVNSAISGSRFLIGSIIVAFFLLALGTSVFVVRALQDQIDEFLAAARRLAGGRFDQPVETAGHDEFAELGREFNRMADQLAAQMREVEGKRRQLQEAIAGIGRALSKGLVPEEVLRLIVETALHACEAEAAHGVPIEREDLSAVRFGRSDPALTAALEEAERNATRGMATVAREGVHAFALRLRPPSDGPDVAVVSLARRESPFSHHEIELLRNLCAAAAVSIENAELHRTVTRQAVTDERTGLPNDRQLDMSLERELDRSRRFGTSVGFVLLDLDNFKSVNDNYSHAQGNAVLAAVAEVLRKTSRQLDEAARWGGEEFAVLLPQTDLDGAAELAERMREEVERLRVPNLEGGEDVRITGSFGVACLPANAGSKEGLVHAADIAMYRAKRNGKNRVERADENPEEEGEIEEVEALPQG